MSLFTSKIVMPEALNESISSFFEEWGTAVVGRTRAKVGWPSRALALVMNCPIAPVAPTTRILLFPILFCLVWWEDQDQISEGTEKQDSVCRGEAWSKDQFWGGICILVHFCLKSKNKEKNDKQPSQSFQWFSLKNVSSFSEGKPNTICKQDYMCKRAPKVKCFLHSNCLYTHIDATSPIFGDRMTKHDHQSTLWFSISICKSVLQTWHSFIPVSSCKREHVQMQTSYKLHQTTYNWITGWNSKVWICLYQ